MLEEDLNDPLRVSVDHLRRLLSFLPSGLVEESLIDHISQTNPNWPVWPTPILSNLIGPPNISLKRFDLRWLHRFENTVALLNHFSDSLGGPSGGPSGLSLIVERAPLLGHRGWGEISAGGSCKLIKTADNTIAVNLPRAEDIDSVSAWLEIPVTENIWDAIEEHAANIPSKNLINRAELLGIAVSLIGEAKDIDIEVSQLSKNHSHKSSPQVVDLSSMWAGPLCSWFLMRSGATVTKIESTHRPDRGRISRTPFFQRLNKGKNITEVDFGRQEGKSTLRKHIRSADIIIESSRPRALENLGICPEEEVGRGAIWCSITGYGRRQNPRRIGFGDDAAAAGNLLAKVEESLWFVGDASADPLTGATAATITHGLWLAGVSGLVDVSLAATAHLHTRGVTPQGTMW
tara:strand:+ start:218 stop:1429 length:1212 start_codon:yes stop_codon:yes gene_type:complete